MINNIEELTVGLGGFTLLQAPTMTGIQMMSYVITSPSGKVLVIDGGNVGDEVFLYNEIIAKGGYVDMWIISHCHVDHYSALVEIMENYDDIQIKKICYNFPPQEWVDKIEPQEKAHNDRIYALFERCSDLCQIVHDGECFDFEGAKIEILNDPMKFVLSSKELSNDNLTVNDSSLVWRITFPTGKTSLFLGDLGPIAGNDLAGRYKNSLKSDMVQMAHHGQNGVEENVYQYIRPDVCLWAAPMWLYNNDLGQGFNTHCFKTIEVREWMKKLGVQHHVVEGEGTSLIK